PSHSAFVSAPSTNKKISYGDSPTHSSTTTYSVPSNSKTGSYRTGNVIKDVLQSFVADTKLEQQLAYEDLEQIEKLDLEKMELKWQMAMLSVRVHKFEQKARRLTLIRRNLLVLTSRMSDATSVNKETILPRNVGQKEEMTRRDTPHSRLKRLEKRKKIQKP
nr:ribonuclease H-like domain, reverse transcriptase, RNA-dependent DNA polymerase [Tanacetum cinerariifolium]